MHSECIQGSTFFFTKHEFKLWGYIPVYKGEKSPDLIILYLVKQLIHSGPSDIKNIKPNERLELTQ